MFFLLLLSTGSRSNEIINIKVIDIDFFNETIYVKKTKNGASKFIVLREGFGAILQRYTDKNHLHTNDFLDSIFTQKKKAQPCQMAAGKS